METSSSRSRECECPGGDGTAENCPVLREFRQLRTAEGRTQALTDYRAECKARGDVVEAGGSAKDLAMRLHRLGVTAQTVSDLVGMKETPALAGARRFVAADPNIAPCLLLLGAVGVGKSVAAAWVLQDFAKRFKWNSQPTRAETQPAMWVDGRELTGVREFKDEHQSWLAAMQRTQLLILDDAGHEATEAGRNALTDILLARIGKRRRTVLTANLSPGDLAKRYGDAVADRLRVSSIIPRLPVASLRAIRGGRR